jgi:hypothetical protein
MSEEIIKPAEVDVSKVLSDMLAKINEGNESNKKLNESIANLEKEIALIKTFEVKKPAEVVVPVVPEPIKVETTVNPLVDLLKAREIEKQRLDEQQKILENSQVKEENELLRLKIAVTEELANKPYLEEVIKEAIKEGRVKNTNDLKILVSPTMEAKLKVAFQLEQDMKKAGIDPFATYNNESVMTNVAEMQNKKEYDAMIAEWQAKLNRK